MTAPLPPLPELVSTAQYELKWFDARLSIAVQDYAKLAVREALERAIKTICDEFIEYVTNEADASYNRGVKHSSQAIRAMIEEYKND